MTFARFMHLALYADAVGYYRKPHARVGKEVGTDFYTNRSLGSVFVRCLMGAVRTLLQDQPAHGYHWVEWGCEPGQETLGAGNNPLGFGRCCTVPYGAPWEGYLQGTQARCVVFANELLDAMPFHRLVFAQGRWQEEGVYYDSRAGVLKPCLMPEPTEALTCLMGRLPRQHPEGYRLDISLQQVDWLRQLMQRPWKGLFIFIDYGATWEDLLYCRPGGTARAYYRHQVQPELLARPSQQDLTAQVCWTLCQEAIAPFVQQCSVVSQEAFFVQFAQPVLQELMRPGFSADKQALQALLSPQHFGRKFQVLWGYK
jgi:SAM-dependent MidA family methyltransferase